MNVNDCLSVEGNCNIANEDTGEVGLDITIKNVNQTHHLFCIEASVGDLHLFCQKFALNREKIFCESDPTYIIYFLLFVTLINLIFVVINNYSSLQSESRSFSELTPNESLNIRCILDEREKGVETKSSFWDRLKANLSSYCVKSIDELSTDILQMNFASNFLIRNEAKYFPFTQQNITNEDMSNVIYANNKHMTLCIIWKASVNDNGKIVRTALGQHFVQIDHLFES